MNDVLLSCCRFVASGRRLLRVDMRAILPNDSVFVYRRAETGFAAHPTSFFSVKVITPPSRPAKGCGRIAHITQHSTRSPSKLT